jgi:murein DD-endopeptidase MepM/ murein hydrolase activator NlpD
MGSVPRRPLAIGLAFAVATLALGAAGEAGPGPTPGAAAHAYAVRITAPGLADVATPTVSSPPGASSYRGTFSSTGAATGAISVGTTARLGDTHAIGTATATISSVNLFDGEITADAVTASAKAGVAPAGAAGDVAESQVTNLTVLGQKVTPSANLRVQLGDWGTLLVLAQGLDRTAPQGASGFRGFVTGLDVHLTQPHGGLPAGAEIVVGSAEASAQSAPPAVPRTSTKAQPLPKAPGAPLEPAPSGPGDLKQEHGARVLVPKVSQPPKLHPKLTAGGYVFPVYGPSSYSDTFGADRSDVSGGWHHGDDIFGQLGQPILAVADGTVFSVGWNTVGGNRLWLRDGAGNEFYYAHLSAYSTLAADGAHVQAGDVLGFMGNTGDAETTPYHLHFEVHPVSLLNRGYDGAVNPTRYLDGWKRLEDVTFPGGGAWAPLVHGQGTVPEPGAILLQVSDISQAGGLDPASLRRALVAQRSG